MNADDTRRRRESSASIAGGQGQAEVVEEDQVRVLVAGEVAEQRLSRVCAGRDLLSSKKAPGAVADEDLRLAAAKLRRHEIDVSIAVDVRCRQPDRFPGNRQPRKARDSGGALPEDPHSVAPADDEVGVGVVADVRREQGDGGGLDVDRVRRGKAAGSVAVADFDRGFQLPADGDVEVSVGVEIAGDQQRRVAGRGNHPRYRPASGRASEKHRQTLMLRDD